MHELPSTGWSSSGFHIQGGPKIDTFLYTYFWATLYLLWQIDARNRALISVTLYDAYRSFAGRLE